MHQSHGQSRVTHSDLIFSDLLNFLWPVEVEPTSLAEIWDLETSLASWAASACLPSAMALSRRSITPTISLGLLAKLGAMGEVGLGIIVGPIIVCEVFPVGEVGRGVVFVFVTGGTGNDVVVVLTIGDTGPFIDAD